MKDRVIACLHYKAEGHCNLGREGLFWSTCQKCNKYKAKPGSRPHPRRAKTRIQKMHEDAMKGWDRWLYEKE